MQRVILFTIGSVQEFITNSRKTLDLQNASNIISGILSKLIKTIEDDYQGKIILPVLDISQGDVTSICPNYFIASYMNDVPIGKELKRVAIETFSVQAKELFRKYLTESELDRLLLEQIEKQLETALDVYWTDIPFDKSVSPQCIDQLYQHMEAIKNTRNFNYLSEPEGEKCHLCGLRNGVIYRKTTKDKAPFKIQKYYTYERDNLSETSIYKLFEKVKKLHPDEWITENSFSAKEMALNLDRLSKTDINLLKKGECLCSVCFAKRYQRENFLTEQKSEKISSSSGFALRDWLKRVDPANKIKSDEELNLLLGDKSELKEIPDDDQKIYHFWEKDTDKVKRVLKWLYNYQDVPAPPLYYCLYRLDLDNLGKRLRLAEYDKELSKIVFDFLKELKELQLENKDSQSFRIIYAGGDDVLALMSIETCYEFTRQVEFIFQNKIRQSKYHDLTYSQGLFFAHHKTTFSEVLRLSREKLNELKAAYQDLDRPKNGTVLSVLTDGFSEQSTFFRNEGSFNMTTLHEVMNYFVQYSTYFHHVLGQKFHDLANLDELDTDMFLSMFFVEQKRLMERSLKCKSASDPGKKEENERAMLQTAELLKDFIFDNCRMKDNRVDLANYFNLLAIIKKLNSQKIGELR